MRPSTGEYPPGAWLPARVIDDFEFVWMLRGTARFTTDVEMPLASGQLLLVPPGVQHTFTWDPRRSSSHGFVRFGSDDVSHPPDARVRLVRMTQADPLSGLCSYLLWLGMREQDDWRPRVRSVLEVMLSLITTGPLPDAEASVAVAPALEPAFEYLRREWARPPLRRISIDELAGVSAVSRGHLNKLFRTTFGLSVSKSLEHARCVRAETMLTHTDMTVEVIARLCGFADISHFSHRFAAIYRVSPRSYRATGGQRMLSVLEHSGVRMLNGVVWGAERSDHDVSGQRLEEVPFRREAPAGRGSRHSP